MAFNKRNTNKNRIFLDFYKVIYKTKIRFKFYKSRFLDERKKIRLKK